ncbi:DUF2920 family protein [Psychrobacillus sp. L4]|uniref:DUF2920 family protein n=1 Tax=Psychrobacillus sp. L4 TaxID=3236892 RepID=UPI0036F20475
MSIEHSINIPAHHNIYTNELKRNLRIDFSIPQNGVNQNTGLLVFVPGFNGSIDSNIYIKMRKIFADKYNMITMQCAYFGYQFMQSFDSFNTFNSPIMQRFFTTNELEKINEDSNCLEEILFKKKIKPPVIPVHANIDESIEEFNDMSYMQAIDIITTIEAVKLILSKENLVFNSNRIIGYGQSHGAYLLYLCNRLVPNLFSLIVDNSAYIEPNYLTSNRFLYKKIEKSTLIIEYDYLAKKIVKNKNDVNLDLLYKDFSTNTQVLSFHGNEDKLVDYIEKEQFVKTTIKKSDFILIKKEDIDNVKYKSNSHGLGADFLELYSFASELEHPIKDKITRPVKYEIDFEGVFIRADYKDGLPIFDFKFK